jgi:poly [ADP-ribose] polymerase
MSDKGKISERALNQPDKRHDLSAAEQKRYQASNTGLLFHGTRSVNVSGILRESLRMPKTLVGVVITGAMFGPGLYFADDWKKSAGYTSLPNSYWSGGGGSVKGRHAFMFAVDVVLGKPFVAPGAHGYTSPPKGHHSVFGKAGVSQVQNNEFIVFDKGQHQLRYLAEFSTSR